ncbi:ECF transporter S component [uncultured Alistipes sp.]|uniref:ECF transporter S component n=1 Tax=uncultured Alistipes sp. TaxID=538949 RepID=UPI001F8DDDA1|nr:ECF transporter S component [uncultured Alistipes sp.]HJC26643.1 ECF transporter S component [Candidatus Alistipes stercoravium]
MQTTSVKLHSLEYRQAKTYWIAALFVLGNILLPQLCHLVPQGGMRWLPIYFFTLVGAYKYGWRVGLLTAVASPLLNSALFGMPAAAALPAILLKSVLLAVTAGYAAARSGKASLWLLAAVVLVYQTVGTLGEWAISGSPAAAVQDFRIGIPGMLLQLFGGWLCINLTGRRA